MANGNTLNVEITSSVEGLKKGLAQADKGLKNFDRSTDKLTKTTAKNTKGMVKGAVPAMTSFSQVIQDAPFGIRGVANNITQLTMQMGHLSKNAGGTSAALKAMGATLMGPAGILLAVSLVTSLLVSYGDELANIGNESGKLIKKNEELVESFEIAGTVLKAQVGALDAQLKLLELQKIPIKELLAEKLKILEADLQSTVQQRTALSNQISAVKATAQQLSLTQKLLNLLSLSQGLGITEFAGIDREELNSINELEADLANLDKTIAGTVLAIGKIRTPEIFDPEKTKSNLKKTKFEFKTFGFGLVGVVKGFNLEIEKANTSLAGGFDKSYNTSLNNINSFRSTLEGLSPALRQTIIDMVPDASQFDGKLAGMVNSLIAFNEQVDNIIKNGIRNTFAGIGEAIGNALANGGDVFQALGGALLQGVGQIAVQLGKAAIKIGVTMIAIKKSFANPATAIAAGVALVAIGSAIGSIAANAINGAGSDTSTDFSDGGSSGFSGGSRGFSGSTQTGGNFVFEIQGTKLIGVIKNTLDRNRALGGSNNLVFG